MFCSCQYFILLRSQLRDFTATYSELFTPYPLTLQKRLGTRHTQSASLTKRRRFVTPFKTVKGNQTPEAIINPSTSGAPATESQNLNKPTNISTRRNLLSKNNFTSPVADRKSTVPIKSTRSEQGELDKAREELRQLKLVEYHRKHNDLETLGKLTEVWREVGHTALHELRDSVTMEPKPSIPELLTQMRIPAEHFNCQCDE